MKKHLTLKQAFLIALGLLSFQALVFYFLGQPFTCECGYIKFWESNVLSPGMSQQLFDWYTFSHIIHGFIFYGILKLIFPHLPASSRFLFAMGLEIGWEIIENTPWVIKAYRAQALAQGYNGDSIINSLFDTLSMMTGFFLARRLPVWVILLLAVLFEVFVGYCIRDGLFLNILNFIHQFDFIHTWQSGG